MSTTTKSALSPDQIADALVSKYLSPDELCNLVINDAKEEDFIALEDALLGDTLSNPQTMIGTTEADQREIARQEICFRPGLEIGKRICGPR